MKKLSPLEIIALTALPEKARIGRIAYLCRQSWEWGKPTSIVAAKETLAKIGEPRGAKGRLAAALRDEFQRQRGLAERRRRRRERLPSTNIGVYDPVTLHHRHKLWRTRAICLVRFNEDRNGLIPAPAHIWNWWTGKTDNYNVEDALIRGGEFFMLVKPWRIWKNGRNIGGQYQWLTYKTTGATGSVRVPTKCRCVDKAIESLKSAAVRKAEAKGATVTIDWENQAFLVQSPRRKKPRSAAFKNHGRNRTKCASN